MTLRQKVVEVAEAWIGCNEADGSHKKIIDTYNAHRPLPVGYSVRYTDAWCATFVSAVGIRSGLSNIILPECSCPRMIEIYKKAGRWVEDDSYTPQIGDIVMYDWQDSGSGDNTGTADHVGIVEEVSGNSMTIIEGNISNAVGRRKLCVNGRYIRGYCCPAYGESDNSASQSVTATTPQTEEVCDVRVNQLRKGSKGAQVKAMQLLLIGYGFSCGSCGADGDFGNDTDRALRRFQNNKGLASDGICGAKTWKKLIG